MPPFTCASGQLPCAGPIGPYCLRQVASSECPSDINTLVNCVGVGGNLQIAIGGFCEGDGECGTSNDVDNCVIGSSNYEVWQFAGANLRRHHHPHRASPSPPPPLSTTVTASAGATAHSAAILHRLVHTLRGCRLYRSERARRDLRRDARGFGWHCAMR